MSQSNTAENQRQALLGRLQAADTALRASLHQHKLDTIACAHLERALAHIREVYVGVNENIRIRTVEQLAGELSRVQQLCEEIRQQPPPGVTVKPFRP